MSPSVLGPAFLVMLRAERPFLSVAHGAQQSAVNPEAYEVALGRIGPPLTEGKVILDRASLVAVSFNPHFLAGISAEPPVVRLQGFCVPRPDFSVDALSVWSI